jgi:serine/threonine protein kinase
MKAGTSFAGYRVQSLVGRGGTGVVYRGTDLSPERPVALKLITPDLAEDERSRARFLREPRLAASLDHPNLIPIYEAGEHDGQLYLAMRFVEGNDLKSVLEREGKLPPQRAVAVLAQVAGSGWSAAFGRSTSLARTPAASSSRSRPAPGAGRARLGREHAIFKLLTRARGSAGQRRAQRHT